MLSAPTPRAGLRAGALALVLVALLGGVSAAQSLEASPVTIDVRGPAGASFKVRARGFTSLLVTLENQSDLDLRGTLRAYRANKRGSDTPAMGVFFEKDVDLPRRGKRTELIYYYVQEDEPTGRLCVAFQPEGETPAPTPAFPQFQRVETLQVLVLSRLGLAEQVKRAVHGARVGSRYHALPADASIGDASALPDHPSGYDPFGAVVLAESELPAERVDPLLQWVAGGGDLWVVASGGRAEVPEKIAAVLPGKRKGLIKRRIDALQHLAPRERPMTRATEAVLLDQVEVLPGAEVLAGTSEEPLILRARFGAGYVTYLTFPLDAGPITGWAGMHTVVGGLLRLPREDGLIDQDTPPDPPLEELTLNLSEAIESLEPPSTWIVAPLLILYVALVSPLNYLLLSRLRKLSLAQVSAGLVAVVFGCAFYVLGLVYKGSEAMITQVGIIEVPGSPGQNGSVEVMTGFFSTDRGQTNAEGPEGALVGPLASRKSTSREARLQWAEGRTKLSRVALDTWALRRFRSQRTEFVGHLEVDLATSATGNGITGTIYNRTSRDLRTPALILENTAIALDDIPAGQKVSVDVVPQVKAGAPTPIPPFFEALLRDSGGNFTPHYGTGLQGIAIKDTPYDGSTERRLYAAFERRLLRAPRPPAALPALLVARNLEDPGGVRFDDSARAALNCAVLIHETSVAVDTKTTTSLRKLPPRLHGYTTADGSAWLPTSGLTGTPPTLEGGMPKAPATVMWRWELPASAESPVKIRKLDVYMRTEPELRSLDREYFKLEYFRFDTGQWVDMGDVNKEARTNKGILRWPKGGSIMETEWPYMVHPQSGHVYIRFRNGTGDSVRIRWVTIDAVFAN